MIGETRVLANCGYRTPVCQTLNQARFLWNMLFKALKTCRFYFRRKFCVDQRKHAVCASGKFKNLCDWSRNCIAAIEFPLMMQCQVLNPCSSVS
jgi:hypothetical protein